MFFYFCQGGWCLVEVGGFVVCWVFVLFLWLFPVVFFFVLVVRLPFLCFFVFCFWWVILFFFFCFCFWFVFFFLFVLVCAVFVFLFVLFGTEIAEPLLQGVSGPASDLPPYSPNSHEVL